MIQIRNNPNRQLDLICQTHYASLSPIILKRTKQIDIFRRNFIKENIESILTAKPKELLAITKKFENKSTESGISKAKIYSKIDSIFNYKDFRKKHSDKYCAYNLAEALNVNVCPYCNRNFTNTVVNRSDLITRPQFDHFFSQSEFPLLSLSFYNLIPCCSICNSSIKGTRKLSLKKHLHPYLNGSENSVRFNYSALNKASLDGDGANYSISFLEDSTKSNESRRGLNSMKFFKLKEIYEQSHGQVIADVIKKHRISGGRYLEQLARTFPKLGNTEELYRIGFGTYIEAKDFEKIPLSKLIKDIVEQLVFVIPNDDE